MTRRLHIALLVGLGVAGAVTPGSAQYRYDVDEGTGQVYRSRPRGDGSWQVDAFDLRTGRRERMDYGTDGVLRGYNRRDGAWAWDGRTYADENGRLCHTRRQHAWCE